MTQLTNGRMLIKSLKAAVWILLSLILHKALVHRFILADGGEKLVRVFKTFSWVGLSFHSKYFVYICVCAKNLQADREQLLCGPSTHAAVPLLFSFFLKTQPAVKVTHTHVYNHMHTLQSWPPPFHQFSSFLYSSASGFNKRSSFSLNLPPSLHLFSRLNPWLIKNSFGC